MGLNFGNRIDIAAEEVRKFAEKTISVIRKTVAQVTVTLGMVAGQVPVGVLAPAAAASLAACGGGDHVEAAPAKTPATASFTTPKVTDGIVGLQFDNIIDTTSNAEKNTWKYASSNTDVATVNEDGTVTYTGLGTTTITVSIPATATHQATTASYTIEVIWNIPADSGWATTSEREDILDGGLIQSIDLGGIQGSDPIEYSASGLPYGTVPDEWIDATFIIDKKTGIITSETPVFNVIKDGIEFPITITATNTKTGKSISRSVILVGRDVA